MNFQELLETLNQVQKIIAEEVALEDEAEDELMSGVAYQSGWLLLGQSSGYISHAIESMRSSQDAFERFDK